MSCECNINLIKSIETKNIKIFKLEGACIKCGSYFRSGKKTKKGEGFAAWAKKLIRAEDTKGDDA